MATFLMHQKLTGTRILRMLNLFLPLPLELLTLPLLLSIVPNFPEIFEALQLLKGAY
jgi:hypothetical protein